MFLLIWMLFVGCCLIFLVWKVVSGFCFGRFGVFRLVIVCGCGKVKLVLGVGGGLWIICLWCL